MESFAWGIAAGAATVVVVVVVVVVVLADGMAASVLAARDARMGLDGPRAVGVEDVAQPDSTTATTAAVARAALAGPEIRCPITLGLSAPGH
jgi:hypothetical protein